MPKLSLDELSHMVRSLVIANDSLQHAMVVGARFKMRGSEVTGCLVLVLGIASFELFLTAVENWANNSTADDPG